MVGVNEKNFERIEFMHNFDTYEYRYAFAEVVENKVIYGIPMCAENVLKVDVENNEIAFLPRNGSVDFAYTGGCYDAKRRCVYGIPRNANTLLIMDVDTDEVKEIPLNVSFPSKGIHGAHHYTGVLVNDTLYCPPRHQSNGILKISLNTLHADVIPLDEIVNQNTHYSGSILHPNGTIYLTPSVGNYFIQLNPSNDKIRVVGDKVDGTIFGGCVVNNNIYCFASTGIVMFDVENEETIWLFRFEEKQTMYGTILHSNGRIYSWSKRNQFVEYNIQKNEYKILATIYDYNNEPIYNAGGVFMNDGNIYFTPCQGRFLMRAVFK